MIDMLLVSTNTRLQQELSSFLRIDCVLPRFVPFDWNILTYEARSSITVILLDLVYDETTTNEAFTLLREKQTELSAPVIALVSTGTESAKIAKLIESGANDCIPYPTSHEEMVARINAQGKFAGNLETLRERIIELEAENAQLREKYGKAIRDNASLNAIINTVVDHDSFIEVQMDQELEQANYQAGHDPLTMLFNRHSFDEYLHKELEKNRKSGETFSLIMMDIDHFKNVNDSYGHDKGDLVLVSIADCVKKRLPDSCVFSRWGGEEFMILTPGFTVSQAFDLAEYLRVSVEKMNVEGTPKITASFGVSEFQSDEDLGTLFSRVDKGMYAAKNGGRNKVCRS